jgi:hypothetical protein
MLWLFELQCKFAADQYLRALHGVLSLRLAQPLEARLVIGPRPLHLSLRILIFYYNPVEWMNNMGEEIRK